MSSRGLAAIKPVVAPTRRNGENGSVHLRAMTRPPVVVKSDCYCQMVQRAFFMLQIS